MAYRLCRHPTSRSASWVHSRDPSGQLASCPRRSRTTFCHGARPGEAASLFHDGVLAAGHPRPCHARSTPAAGVPRGEGESSKLGHGGAADEPAPRRVAALQEVDVVAAVRESGALVRGRAEESVMLDAEGLGVRRGVAGGSR